jgi:hypothetical protein
MIAEEFDSGTWGGQRKAIAARTKRVKELEEMGYEVDTATRYYGLAGVNRGYRLFAHRPIEMNMRTPDNDFQREPRVIVRNGEPVAGDPIFGRGEG